MQSPNDWKNVEMTGYIKVNQFSGSDLPFTWYARGGRDTDSAPCEGTSIKEDYPRMEQQISQKNNGIQVDIFPHQLSLLLML